jgi:hypothetical protein
MKKNYFLAVLLAAGLLVPVFLQAQISTFDDLKLDSANAYWNGSDTSGGFQSGSVYFYNSYNQSWGSWSGFAYSNVKNDTTAGYTNQYAAITASGVFHSSKYAVVNAYSPAGLKLKGKLAEQTLKGMYVTNATYPALSMENGDSFAKKFGGSDGNDPDWFLLTVKGYDKGTFTDSVNFYLADYRFKNNDSDYLVKTWKWVDLHGLGAVDSVTFVLHSSDTGQYGMNTPAYFCMDNFNDTVYVHSAISTFDDVSLDPENAYWNGSDLAGGFASGHAWFYNSYNPSWGSWSGFAYSNMKNDTTAGWTNQYSAITAAGVNGSKAYGVAYAGAPVSVKLDSVLAGSVLKGVFVTNSTYAALSMENGDQYAKKFGGADGTDPDWFLLTIKGYDKGTFTDSVNFYLADFRSDNSADDYILKSWAWVNLQPLGAVDSLTFELHSSDVGQYGMNTPAYFCLDNLNDVTNGVSALPSGTKSFALTLYPNPVVNTLNLRGVKDAQIAVYDINGRKVFETSTSSETLRMNVSAYPKGLYLVRVSKGQVVLTKKFVKK